MKELDEQVVVEKKIRVSRLTMIYSFILALFSLGFGIMFLYFDNISLNKIISTIFFSVTGISIAIAIFFEYRYRTLLKYYYIAYATYHKEEERIDKTKEPRDKAKILEENQPGSFFKNVRKYLERHRGP